MPKKRLKKGRSWRFECGAPGNECGRRAIDLGVPPCNGGTPSQKTRERHFEGGTRASLRRAPPKKRGAP